MSRPTVAVLLFAFIVGLSSSQAADEHGEIRLTSPLSSIPWQLVVGPEDKFVAVSGRDRTISQFDLDDDEGVRDVIFPLFVQSLLTGQDRLPCRPAEN
jgi:hypothetical protein